MAVPAGDLWTLSASKNTEEKVVSVPENLWLKDKKGIAQSWKNVGDKEGSKH